MVKKIGDVTSAKKYQHLQSGKHRAAAAGGGAVCRSKA